MANRVLDPPYRSKPVADGSAFQMQRQVMKCGHACASRAREAVDWTRAQRRRHRGHKFGPSKLDQSNHLPALETPAGVPDTCTGVASSLTLVTL